MLGKREEEVWAGYGGPREPVHGEGHEEVDELVNEEKNEGVS